MKASSNHAWQAVCLTILLLGSLAKPAHPINIEHREGNVGFDTSGVRAQSRSTVGDAYCKLPLTFEENRGQVDRAARYLSRGPNYNLFLTASDAVLEVKDNRIESTPPARQIARSASIRLRLIGSNPTAAIEAADELTGKINYFHGNDPKQWLTNVPAYKTVTRRAVYPGVDIVYYGNQQQLEYDLIVAPGADPEVISLGFDDVRSIHIDEKGDLVLKTEVGDIRQHRPFAYQEDNGVKQEVEARYSINHGREVRFEIGEYDASRPLVIDPVLTYSTYLGGTAVDEAYGIAVDSDGNAYVTGTTASTAFPTARAFQS